ncbi:MAG TPA: YeeE/YedE family protein [Anaerolineales bacterium]|nr:YeeE/YedE family protein [Anaerolineales bacterium]
MTIAILSGLLVGILFGFALQRGRFCMNSAIRDTILLQDTTLLKGVGVAILVGMFGFGVMALAGLIKFSPTPLFWGANLVGGIIFGIGMVLAGGCASGITYRVGEGMVGALSALIGLAAAGTLTAMGFLAPIKNALQTNTKIMVGEANPTLANIFGLPTDVVAVVLAIILAIVWFVIARKNREDSEPTSGSMVTRIFKKGWAWLPTGIVIGLINMLAFYLSTLAGRSYPLAITSGWIGIVKVIFAVPDSKLGWDAFLVIGIIVGAFIAAMIASEFKIRWPGWKMVVQTLIGGLLMGFGAVTSAGCNVTHILSGLPQLGLGSLLGAISIVIGAWLAAYVIFVRRQKA